MDYRKLPGFQNAQPTPQNKSVMEQFQQHQADVQAKNAAQMVVDKFKDEQRRLFSSIIGNKVHDVIEFVDDHGDDQIATVFADYKGKDLVDGTNAVIQLINLEQTKQTVIFVGVVFKAGKYWDKKTGQNFILAAVAGSYAPVMSPKDIAKLYEQPNTGEDQG